MTRRRYVQINGELVEVPTDYTPEPRAPLIFGDLPEYVSPVSGLVISGRRARREEFKRTGTRPWEGLAQEKQEAARREQYAERRLDESLTRAASEAFYQLPPSKRATLKRI